MVWLLPWATESSRVLMVDISMTGMHPSGDMALVGWAFAGKEVWGWESSWVAAVGSVQARLNHTPVTAAERMRGRASSERAVGKRGSCGRSGSACSPRGFEIVEACRSSGGIAVGVLGK